MSFSAQVVPVSPLVDLRTARRRVVNFRAYVRESHAPVLTVEVTNLSTDGCHFLSGKAFETRTRLWIKIDGLGARQARVIWRSGGRVGCEFLSPIETTVIDEHFVKRAERLRGRVRGGASGVGGAGPEAPR